MKKLLLIMSVFLFGFPCISNATDYVSVYENYTIFSGREDVIQADMQDPYFNPIVSYSWTRVSGNVLIISQSEAEIAVLGYVGTFEIRYYAVYGNGDTMTLTFKGQIKNANGGNNPNGAHNPDADSEEHDCPLEP